MPAAAPRGVVRVDARALQHTLQAVVRDTVGGRVRDVDARLEDEGGGLALVVGTTLVPPLSPTLLADLHRDRVAIARRFGELTDRAVSRVDLRITGLREPARARPA